MSVKNIEKIQISGFGSYSLYSFEYTPGVAENYGSINAEFFNKTGVYSIPEMSHTFFPVSIQTSNSGFSSLGTFTPISYEINKTGDFKVFKVGFADKSVELDRYLVAVRGQVGYDSVSVAEMSAEERAQISGETTVQGRIIWIGKSDESCKESILGGAEKQDPCDPCENGTDSLPVNRIDCSKYYLIKKRVYQYTFSQLIEALSSSSMGISFSSSLGSEAYKDYKFEYGGSVREVLNNVCSEIGISFYYQPQFNQIRFVDSRGGIKINIKSLETGDNKLKILESSEKISRESSKDVFGVSSFQREAEEKTYGCGGSECKKLTLNPIVLDGFLPDAAHFKLDEITSSKSNLFERLEFYSVLSGRTSRDFRDLFLWHQEYGFAKASDVKGAIGKKLSALNGMTIRKVFASDSSASEDKIMYRLLLSASLPKDFDDAKEKIKNNKPYFFLAETDEKQDEKVHNLETSLCDSFFGQYWVRGYKQHWPGLNYSILNPDGSVDYYDFKKPVSLPFADIITEAGGVLEDSEIFQRLDKESFYLMSRPAVFSPLKLEESDKKNIDDNVERYGFKEVAISPDMDSTLEGLADLETDYRKKTYKLYMVNNELESSSSVSLAIDEAKNEDEVPNVIIPIFACAKNTSYGLKSANAKKFSVSFKSARFSITMPAQSFTGSTHSGYVVLIQKSGDEKTSIVPKTEIFSSGAIPSAQSTSLGIEFNSYNATTNDLKYLANSAGKKICSMKMDEINTLLSSLSGLMNYSIGNSEEKTYKIEGFPLDFYTVEDGLKSMSIMLGSSGLTTSLVFDNTFAFRLTPDALLKKLKYLRFQQLQNQFPKGNVLENKSNDLRSI